MSLPSPTTEAGTNTTPPTGKRSTTRRAWAVTVMILVLMMLNFADKSVLGLAAGPLMADLGLTASQFGLAGSIFFLLFGISGIVVGFLGNRIASTRLLLLMALGWSVSMAPLLLAPAFATLLVSRVLLGAAEGPTVPVAVHGVHKWFPESRRSIPTSFVIVGASLGVALSAPVLTYFITHHGWQSAFWILAVAGLIWAAAWLVIGREGPFTSYAAAADLRGESSSTVEETRIPYRTLFAVSGWWGPLLAMSPAFWAFALFNVWGPSYLVKGLGFAPQTMGLLVGLYALIALAGQLGFSWLSGALVRRGVDTRWARGALTGAVVALSGALILASMLAHENPLSPWVMLIGFGLTNSVSPVGFLTVSEVSPVRQRSAMLATYNSVLTMGGAVAPFVAGVLVDRASDPIEGYRLAFVIFGALAVAGGLLAAWLSNPSRDAIRLGLRAGSTPPAS